MGLPLVKLPCSVKHLGDAGATPILPVTDLPEERTIHRGAELVPASGHTFAGDTVGGTATQAHSSLVSCVSRLGGPEAVVPAAANTPRARSLTSDSFGFERGRSLWTKQLILGTKGTGFAKVPQAPTAFTAVLAQCSESINIDEPRGCDEMEHVSEG